MKTVNSLSGGKTSAYIGANYPADINLFSLVRIENQKSKFPDKKIRQLVEDRIQKPFIATAEDDTIIYTMLDLEQFIGQEIKWISGVTFDQLIKNKGQYLPNKIARYCTTELKTIPIATYLYEQRLNPVKMRFGYRANETRRAVKMNEKLNANGCTEVSIITGKRGTQNKWTSIEYCKPEFPLIEANIYKDTIENFWKDKPVRFAYMNNCVGCWWRSPLLLKKMSQKHPQKMNWFADMEKNSKGTFQTGITYHEILKHKLQIELFDEDFNECDSGYCGI
jgi:hypothetical protein